MAREQFEAFASGAVPRLYRAAFLMVGDHHRAEDLAQDVLARVYVAWPRINGDPHGYAYRALANAAANQRRWRSRHPEDSLELDHAERSSGPRWDDQVLARSDLLAALRELPPRQRVVIVLRYYVDLTEVQTAQALDISVGTVKSQHARALARLRVELGEDLDVTPPDPSANAAALGEPEALSPTTNGSPP